MGELKRRGKDEAGGFTEHLISYLFKGNRISLVSKRYKDGCWFWLENDLLAGFSHKTAEFLLPPFEVKRMLCFCNTFQGQKVFPTNLKEFRFMLSMAVSNLLYAIRRPKSFFRYLQSYMDKDKGYGAWSYPKWIEDWEELPPHCFLLLADAKPSFVLLAPAAFGQKCRLRGEKGLRCEA